MNVYLYKAAPHWVQRETLLAYHKDRKSPDELLISYQMSWKGENFYTGNKTPAFVSSGQRACASEPRVMLALGTGRSMHDYYELLGVSPFASKKEIARAYRRRTVSRHRSELLQLKDELELMQEAFETLSDPDKRRDYDLRRELELSPADRAEEARFRREGRLRAKYARQIARTSQKLGQQSVASHAGMMQAIGDEHDRLEARAARKRRLRELLRSAALVLLVGAAAAWFLLSR